MLWREIGGLREFEAWVMETFTPPPTPTKKEEKEEMATSLVSENVGVLNARIEALEAELAMARQSREFYTPEEPSEDGAVIRFKKYNLSYTFAAIRAYTDDYGDGIWFVTQDGTRSSAQGHGPKEWDDLLDWIGERNWHRIEVLG